MLFAPQPAACAQHGLASHQRWRHYQDPEQAPFTAAVWQALHAARTQPQLTDGAFLQVSNPEGALFQNILTHE